MSEPIHVLAKPFGAVCDLACDYCFYVEKRALFGCGEDFRMSDDVLQAFIAQYVAAQPTPFVEFVWHGGEPTLRGLEFFRRVVDLQRPFAADKTIRNVLQTNGMTLTDEWCAFLKARAFFVGLSLDGPRAVHDRYRKGRAGQPTFDGVMRGLRLLQQHGVAFNVLACVGRETAHHPTEVYRFFRDEGVEFVQFTPIVERTADGAAQNGGLRLAAPASLTTREANGAVTDWSVEPRAYGEFLTAVFDEWVRHDVGRMFIMNFEWALTAWLGEPSPVCVFAEQCGRAVAVEHDGSVYACDHHVYPEYRLGNVRTESLRAMVDRSVASGFGPHKSAALPRRCRECDVLGACWGGCPKHRFATSAYDEPGLQYLCEGYQTFFRHVGKYLPIMATLIANDLPASLIMQAFDGPLVIPLKK